MKGCIETTTPPIFIGFTFATGVKAPVLQLEYQYLIFLNKHDRQKIYAQLPI